MVSVSQRAASVESFKVMDVLQRANQLQALGHRVLHCEVGQPETGAPAAVAQAAVAALSSPNPRVAVMGYTDAFGLLELREKISQHYCSSYPTETTETIPTSRIVVTTGSSGAFLLAFTACFDAGDVVAIASSGYPCYRNILQALGCQLCNVPINAEFKLTAKELRAEIQRRAADAEHLPPLKGLILSSPSNPTGAMLTPDELRELCELTDEHGIQFLSDEIYHGISYGTKEATALQYSNNAIVINSFSKYYSSELPLACCVVPFCCHFAGPSLTKNSRRHSDTWFSIAASSLPVSGWRLGWMVIPEALIDPINSLQQNMFINAPTISQTAALRCWDEDCSAELQQHVAKYRASRAIILKELARIPEIDPQNIAPADGGFYVYVDLGDENVADDFGSVSMCQALLEEQHVAFTPGNDFEDPASKLGDRRFRISYSQGVDVATEALERFHAFWPTWLERVRQAKSSLGSCSNYTAK